MKTPWRIHECALARWRISLDASSCSSRHVNTVSLSCRPKSHTHLQRNPIYLKISSFLLQMRWNPSATSVTVVWQMTIARCRWSATIVRWFLVWYAFVAVLQWLLQMFWCKWGNCPFHRGWTGWRVREACNMYMRIRVRVIKLRCILFFLWNAKEKPCWRTHLQISELAKSLQKVAKKYASTFGRYVVKQ